MGEGERERDFLGLHKKHFTLVKFALGVGPMLKIIYSHNLRMFVISYSV